MQRHGDDVRPPRAARRVRLFVVGLFVGALALTGASSASAAVPGAIGLQPVTLKLSPKSGPPGSSITVRGTGFDPGICGGRAGLKWRGGGLFNVQHVSLRADGTFTATVKAPARALFGSRARLVSSCGPGPFGLPGPRATFRLTPKPAEPAQPSKPVEPSKPDGGGGDGGGGGNGSGGGGSGASGGGGSRDGSTAGGSSSGGTGTVVPIDTTPTTAPTSAPTSAPTTAPTPGPSASAAPALAPSPGPTSPAAQALPAASRTGPASTTGTTDLHPARVTASVPTAQEAGFAPKIALLALALAALFVVLVAFPAELFNNTVESNAEEIRAMLGVAAGWLGLRGMARAGESVAHRVGTRGGQFIGFVVVGTLLTAVLAGNESADGNWPAQIVGLLIAIAVVTLIAELPEEIVTRRVTGVPATLKMVPVAVVVAVVCTLLSRLLGLEPSYLYGLFAGFATLAAREMTPRQEGRAVLASVVAVGVFGVACYFLWGPVHAAAYAGDPTWPEVLLDTVLFWCFALSTEGLVFALVPLSFLDGATLRAWHWAAWFVPQALAAAFFIYLFVLKGSNAGQLGADAVIRAVAFFAVFGLLSVGVWLYFRWTGRPTHALAAESQAV
ncbi:FGLLP motif-containing membrane protein [Spongisporangium articulatum]|uniref:FGLLP motif-containing membrane protein n=1 Tax=Spongisporangium articulatum TaxID=3362603 RepID=A0ABW8APF9_9ACTN